MIVDKPKNTKPRGFAAMTEEKRKAIASKGGKAVHEVCAANRFDSDTGRKAVSMRKDREK